MSIHMPTLFDDEEYFVPPPKKETRKKKEVPEVKDEGSEDPEAEAVVPADLAVPSQPSMEAGEEQEGNASSETDVDVPVASAEDIVATEVEQPIEDTTAEEQEETEIQAEPIVALTEEEPQAAPEEEIQTAPEEALDEAVTAVTPEIEELWAESIPEVRAEISPEEPAEQALPESETIAVEEASVIEPEATEVVVIEAEEVIELEQEAIVAENIAAEMLPEVIEVSAVDQLSVELPKATPGITFEIPEEGAEPGIEIEMTARPIPTVREDKVDDLDQLMRTELISQDYTAFSGFEFEPLAEKKKIIPEPEAEAIPEEPAPAPKKEGISQALQDIDAAALDFDFESAALASSLPEFELENKYYTIGEVAALFGVNVSHIRFWTTEFNLKVRTTRKGDRLYNPENIARLRLIHHLVKENGFTIKGAKDKLKNQKQNVSAQIDLKNKLSGLKDKLERIKKNL